MHKREGKKFWKTVATVAGNQRKGKGTTYDEQSIMQLDYVPNQLRNKWFKNLTRKE